MLYFKLVDPDPDPEDTYLGPTGPDGGNQGPDSPFGYDDND